MIKKHKIKISPDKQNSGFVVDLRSSQSKIVKDNFVLPKIEEIKDSKNKKNKGEWRSETKDGFKFKPVKLKIKIPKIKLNSFNLNKSVITFPKLKKVKFSFGRKRRIWNSGRLNYPKKGKTILWLFLIMLFLIIPFKIYSYYSLIRNDKIKNSLMDYSVSGVDGFISASNNLGNLDLAKAQESFLQAGQNFLSLNKELQKIDEFVVLLASLSSNKEMRLASESKDIAKLGVYLASAGNNLSLAIDSLMASFSSDKVATDFSGFNNYSKKSLDDFKKANKYLKKINQKSLPEEYREQFNDLKRKSEILESNMSSFIKMIPALEDFLGVKTDKKYLIVFQNNAELRASGGFIGSYALVDLKKGKIKNIEVPAGGSYDTEGGMNVLVESPQPLHLVKPTWYFWDANWWPDWRMSSRNLMWFLEKSAGPSVDGVISLTPEVLRDILEMLGPVDLTEKYGIVVDSNNFWDVIQEIVEVIGQPEVFKDKELKTDILGRVDINSLEKMKATSSAVSSNTLLTANSNKLIADYILNKDAATTSLEEATSTEIFLRNEPKKIIGDLMSKILEKFSTNFNQEILVKTLSIVENNLSKKNILLYFTNKDLQREIEERSWAGQVKDSPMDYLMVVDTNIAGGKTSYFVDNKYKIDVNIKSDGSIVNKLTIEKKHLGKKGDLFSGIRNVNWLRVYVPLGSTLIKAQGFSQPEAKYFKEAQDSASKNDILQNTENKYELDAQSQTKIYQESDKTVFANWTMIDPGNSETIEIEYKLPYNFYTLFQGQPETWWDKLFPKNQKINYSLLWQKQPGSQISDINFNFKSDLTWLVTWAYPGEAKISHSSVNYSGLLESDRYTAIILE